MTARGPRELQPPTHGTRRSRTTAVRRVLRDQYRAKVRPVLLLRSYSATVRRCDGATTRRRDGATAPRCRPCTASAGRAASACAPRLIGGLRGLGANQVSTIVPYDDIHIYSVPRRTAKRRKRDHRTTEARQPEHGDCAAGQAGRSLSLVPTVP